MHKEEEMGKKKWVEEKEESRDMKGKKRGEEKMRRIVDGGEDGGKVEGNDEEEWIEYIH